MLIDLAWKTQILLILAKKIIILVKYSDFANVFFNKLAIKLPKRIAIGNKHLINLKLDKQPFYGLIYSLRLVELEPSKKFIKINLVNNFIRPFKSFAKAFILFV